MIELGALETPKLFDNTRYFKYYHNNPYGDFPWERPLYNDTPPEGFGYSFVPAVHSKTVQLDPDTGLNDWMSGQFE